ncbi:MAG: sulfatase, partial [Rikenellaceae bacterium]
AFGYAGDPNVKTPNIDKFASESVNFTNAVSVCPVSTPHRAALMTGRYPTSTGMFLNDLYLPDDELCMAEIFKAAGYNTAYIGKWHLDGHGRINNVEMERRQGFDYWKGLECSHDYNKMPYYDNEDPEMHYWDGYSPYAISEDANSYLEDNHNNDNPFLLFVSIATPHNPHFSAPEDMKAMYPVDELELKPNVPTSQENRARKELQGYYGHCTASDKAIGTILDQLKELGLMENTIVVFSSDHGEMMGSHDVNPFAKQVSWDESIRVPFLISYPGIDDNKGTVVNAPINTPDILPTLLGLADVSIPKTIEGEDISKLVTNPNAKADRVSLVMNPAPFGGDATNVEYRAIRTKQYTYERTLDGPRRLFDNIADPYQLTNLVDDPAYSSVLKDLDKKLNKELKRIDDPFESRKYYLDRWGYTVNANNAIQYFQSTNENNLRIQTPTLQE